MKKLLTFTVVAAMLCSIALIHSCAPPAVDKPTACFTLSDDTVTVGATLVITDCSKDGNTYLWDFGDGETSSQNGDVTHVYNSAGTYTITLNITNSGGTRVKTATVVVSNNGLTASDYVGSYNCTDVCGAGNFSYNITITSSGTNSIVIHNFGGFTPAINVTATVNNTTIAIPTQTPSGAVYSVTGTGSASNGTATLTISHTEQDGVNTFNCVTTAIKQ
ncbi:MAG: PKD domain-containing protein [Chitinophagales bacterium]